MCRSKPFFTNPWTFLQVPKKKYNRVSNPLQEMNYLNPGDNRWEKWNLNVDDTNFELAGAPGRTRTSNLLIRSPKIAYSGFYIK